MSTLLSVYAFVVHLRASQLALRWTVLYLSLKCTHAPQGFLYSAMIYIRSRCRELTKAQRKRQRVSYIQKSP